MAKSDMALYPNIFSNYVLYACAKFHACIIKRTIRLYCVTYRLH